MNGCPKSAHTRGIEVYGGFCPADQILPVFQMLRLQKELLNIATPILTIELKSKHPGAGCQKNQFIIIFTSKKRQIKIKRKKKKGKDAFVA
jgi:hypothetical protein